MYNLENCACESDFLSSKYISVTIAEVLPLKNNNCSQTIIHSNTISRIYSIFPNYKSFAQFKLIARSELGSHRNLLAFWMRWSHGWHHVNRTAVNRGTEQECYNLVRMYNSVQDQFVWSGFSHVLWLLYYSDILGTYLVDHECIYRNNSCK